jgi:hypothetical protein
MPIKYNLTKNDILAGKFHQLTQRKNGSSSEDDDLLMAAATLIASFSSAHSWQTYKHISSMDMDGLRCTEVKTEYLSAEQERWKHVSTRDIDEVARMNITPSLFSIWLCFNIDKSKKKLYKDAWDLLTSEFEKECDTKGATS